MGKKGDTRSRRRDMKSVVRMDLRNALAATSVAEAVGLPAAAEVVVLPMAGIVLGCYLRS